MKDRVSTYPGRVVLTPVSGQANTYDMERADVPLEQGTPYNTASVLTDSTAALMGLNSDAVPNDMFAALSNGLNSKMENKSIDSTPTQNSNNLVTSGGVYTAIANKIVASTTTLTPNSSALTSGVLYVVYK